MAQARSTRGSSSTSGAVIGSGTRVRGRVTGEGDLSVEGAVEGPIAIRGDLTIGDGGSAGEVEAHDVTVSGALDGDVMASGMVRLLSGARVRGNLKGTGIAIDDGARFAGRIDCEFDLPAELEGGRSAPATRKR